MNKKLVLSGFLIECDEYNRLKLMFISDYNTNDKNIPKDFTKEYITKKNSYYKSKNSESYCPISGDNYFYIKSKKKQQGLIPLNKLEYLNETNPQEYNIIRASGINGIVNVDVKYLFQNLVKCIVEVNEYKFKINNNVKEGYNFKIKQISSVN
mgnify:CR=1 FL=1